MSNALLLRLFKSEFFNSWIAVSYLFRYPDNVGIQHYLCSELNKFPLPEIEFFLPQLIHLLISRPSDSVALECFLIDLCEKSTHMAIMTLWYLQSYVSDLSATPNSPSFVLCRRLLNMCQTIVFSDGNIADIELADAASSMNLGISTHKVQERALPALVGMGAMLTAFAQPLMTKQAGQVAIAQGRRNTYSNLSSHSHPLTRRKTLNGASPTTNTNTTTTNYSINNNKVTQPDNENININDGDNNDINQRRTSTQSTSAINDNKQHDVQYQSASQPDLPISKKRLSQFNPLTSSPSLEDLHHGKAFSMSRYLKSAQNKLQRKIQTRGASSPSLREKSSNSSSKKSNKSNINVFDPKLTALGQSSVPTNTEPLSPSISNCSSAEEILGNRNKRLSQHRFLSSSTSVFDLSDEDKSNDDEKNGNQSDDSNNTATTSYTKDNDNKHQRSNGHHRDDNNSNSNNNTDDSSSDSDDGYEALAQLSTDHRKLLLKSNHFRSEIQFVLALVDIATRLVIVPKEARMSALQAELSLLNHNLPAEVCLPLWCPATCEKPYHHRVVRISPADAVVLNSAERVPYLITIEVLEDEMNFDDDYMSALYRMRQHRLKYNSNKEDWKKKKSKKSSSSKKNKNKSKHHQHQYSEQKRKSSSHKEGTDAIPVVDMGECLNSIDIATVTTKIGESNNGSTYNGGEGDGSGELQHIKQVGSTINQSSITISSTSTTPSSRRQSIDNYAERMRTAAVMLAQLQQNSSTSLFLSGSGGGNGGNGGIGGSGESRRSSSQNRQGTEQIRQKIIKEMLALEEQRMEKMKKEGVSDGNHVSGGQGEGEAAADSDLLEDENYVNQVVKKEDPSAAVLSEDWEMKKARIRASSPYGHLPNWRLLSVIVKQGTDLRQEQFAIQLIRELQRIWQDTGVDVWVKYFRVLITSDNSGLIETLRNTISIHSIKKNAYLRGWNTKGVVYHLNDYYERKWGPADSDEYMKAQDAFMRSLAGYSIACYLLQIKDRHNGNILIDEVGHLIHIDFGFMLSNSPGSVGFEMAPFKLPQEYIDILGGVHGEKFAEYKALMKAAFLAVRKHSENILLLVEMMSKDSKQACFQSGDQTIQQLRDRFQLHMTEPQAEDFVDRMIMSSYCNVFTRLYDSFQYYSQGIL
ncbi:kinase-like domain-containing protein [Cunninghamella echinulata]|nr:kinase-like domain-containing protein [Cunninghamella echinulata]